MPEEEMYRFLLDLKGLIARVIMKLEASGIFGAFIKISGDEVGSNTLTVQSLFRFGCA